VSKKRAKGPAVLVRCVRHGMRETFSFFPVVQLAGRRHVLAIEDGDLMPAPNQFLGQAKLYTSVPPTLTGGTCAPPTRCASGIPTSTRRGHQGRPDFGSMPRCAQCLRAGLLEASTPILLWRVKYPEQEQERRKAALVDTRPLLSADYPLDDRTRSLSEYPLPHRCKHRCAGGCCACGCQDGRHQIIHIEVVADNGSVAQISMARRAPRGSETC